MRDEILKFAIEMDKIMNKHQHKKGNSWKTLDIDFLKTRLVQEFNEYCKDTNDRKELIDIANMCMMLYDRIIPWKFSESNEDEII